MEVTNVAPSARLNQTSQVDFFILNYSLSSLRAKYRDNLNMKKVRVNFAPHAYMFPACQPGDTRRVNIHVALYTQWSTGSPLEHLLDPNLHGIEECNQSDAGRISVNPNVFLSQ